MKTGALVVAVSALMFDCVLAQDANPARPSAAVDEILQRCVQETVFVTPGRNGFPQDAVIGSEKPMSHERPRERVRLHADFRISKYEVTQELYQAVTGRNPSRWKGPRNSVETVTWRDAVRFCEQLTATLQERHLIKKHQEVRLPTSVEWEFCCRAGSESDFCFGASLPLAANERRLLDQFAWHTGNAAGNDPAVGVLKPNAWGLYDVHGYLWELTSDEPPDRITRERIIRGGSWRDRPALLSCSTYLTVPDHVMSDAIGFRIVIADIPQEQNGAE